MSVTPPIGAPILAACNYSRKEKRQPDIITLSQTLAPAILNVKTTLLLTEYKMVVVVFCAYRSLKSMIRMNTKC